MKYLLFLLVLVSCSRSLPKNSCIVEGGKNGGYYKVLEEMDYSYIARAYGSYIRHSFEMPQIVPKTPNLYRVDCFDNKKFIESYEKYVLERDPEQPMVKKTPIKRYRPTKEQAKADAMEICGSLEKVVYSEYDYDDNVLWTRCKGTRNYSKVYDDIKIIERNK